MRIMEIGWKADIFAGPAHQSQTLRAAAQDIQSTGSRRQFPGVPGIHTNKIPLLSVSFSRDEKAKVKHYLVGTQMSAAKTVYGHINSRFPASAKRAGDQRAALGAGYYYRTECGLDP